MGYCEFAIVLKNSCYVVIIIILSLMASLQSHNQQQTVYGESENFEEFETIRPIVVTGFGRIDPNLDSSDESNLSWRVVEKLSETIIDSQGRAIPVFKGKPSQDDKSIPEPVKVCYNYIEDPCFQDWLDSTDALIYVHLGVEDNLGSVKLETTGRLRGVSFEKDKYNHEQDDTPLHLSENDEKTSFKISDVLCEELKAFKSEIMLPTSCSENPLQLTYGPSDDAGNFLCDFLYYVSLNLATKRNSISNPNSNFPRNVLFVHIPDGLPLDIPYDCYDQCMSEKADALAEVVEFLVKKLLEQIEDHAVATVEQ